MLLSSPRRRNRNNFVERNLDQPYGRRGLRFLLYINRSFLRLVNPQTLFQHRCQTNHPAQELTHHMAAYKSPVESQLLSLLISFDKWVESRQIHLKIS